MAGNAPTFTLKAILAASAISCVLQAPITWSAELYRWVDAQGRVHFGDQPPANAEAQTLKIQARRPWRRAEVKSVTDGDTLKLTNGETIRLLNINTPELPRRGRPGEALAEEARDALIKLTQDKTVEYKPGEQQRDKYDRLLALVRDESGQDLSMALLRLGMARLDVRSPNDQGWQDYAAAERGALESGIGIWALPDYRIMSANEAAERRNLFTRVSATVSKVENSKAGLVLELGSELSCLVPEEFPSVMQWASAINAGRTLTLRGTIRQRNKRPVLYLRHLSQIEGD
ncbi:MAG: thermonuclease family protein [Gammaproteobacteria bacterium]